MVVTPVVVGQRVFPQVAAFWADSGAGHTLPLVATVMPVSRVLSLGGVSCLMMCLNRGWGGQSLVTNSILSCYNQGLRQLFLTMFPDLHTNCARPGRVFVYL